MSYMQGRRLRIGVIGTGHMGRNHVRNLAEETRYFELVGIYDKNAEQAKSIAEQYGTKSFETLEELLELTEAVVVAVPSSLHKEVGLLVAEKKVHALIEKPLSTTVADAVEIKEAFERNNVILAVGHIERFNPVVTVLDKLINRDQIFSIEVHRYSPFSGSGRITDTSVIEDLMIHDIDLVCHLMGENDDVIVTGAGEKVRSDNIDYATCLLKFRNNAHAVVSASRVAQNKERSVTIHTIDSCIYADLLTKTLTVTKNTDLTIEVNGENSYTQDGVVQKIFVPMREPLRTELIAFARSVTEGLPVLVDGNMGIRAIKICEEVVKQANGYTVSEQIL